MKLSDELLEHYCSHRHPGSTRDEIEQHATAFRHAVASGERHYEDGFVALSEGGDVIAALSLVQVHAGAFALSAPPPTLRALANDVGLVGLVEEALGRARQRRAHTIYLRTEKTSSSDLLEERLRGLGFRARHTRVEFCAAVDQLPDDGGTPLAWTSMASVESAPLAEAAKILAAATRGDPDWEPDDDPLEMLAGFLAQPGLRGEADCVQIATLAGSVAGIVIAQVSDDDGWSRITYMGLVAELRGQGLGQWLHRRGFAMMKAQGGSEYHGGTVTTNQRMISLFLKHGCKRDRLLQDWVLMASPD